MNQIKGGGNFPVQTARYMVGHSGTMGDGPMPVFACHLIFYEVGADHLDALNQTVSALSFGRGFNDLVLVVVYPPEAIPPYEFGIKVGGESAGKSAYVCAELGKGVYDLILCSRPEAVNQQYRVATSTRRIA